MSAGDEIEKLKAAFESYYCDQMAYNVADIFWPFVEFYMRTKIDPKKGMLASDIKIMARFKKALDMPLMEWEKGMAMD